MTHSQRGVGAVVQLVWIFIGLLLAAAAVYHLVVQYRGSRVTFGTPYQAILLTNGSVYFGHLQDYGSAHPVLVDVYYIITETNPQTKQYLNPAQILFVEPVGADSKVAQLIAQAKP